MFRCISNKNNAIGVSINVINYCFSETSWRESKRKCCMDVSEYDRWLRSFDDRIDGVMDDSLSFGGHNNNISTFIVIYGSNFIVFAFDVSVGE